MAARSGAISTRTIMMDRRAILVAWAPRPCSPRRKAALRPAAGAANARAEAPVPRFQTDASRAAKFLRRREDVVHGDLVDRARAVLQRLHARAHRPPHRRIR